MIWHYAKRTLASITLFAAIAAGLGLGYVTLSGGKLLSVQSGSMVPAYNKGDLVVTTRVPDSRFAVGDVVTFISPIHKNQTITHRIVELPSANNKGQYVTKGDANHSVDPLLEASSIVGRVDLGIPYVGYFMDFIRQPLGLLLLIYLPALMIIISELRLLARHYKASEPFVAAGVIATLGRLKKSANWQYGPKSAVMLSVLAFGVGVPAHAMLLSSATIVDSSISTFVPTDNVLIHKVKLTGSGQNTNTSTNNTTVIDVSNSNRQTATTGNVTNSGNSNSGNTSSGSASNNNSSNTTIIIDNGGTGGNSVGIQSIEIYNPLNQSVNLKNWSLTDDDGKWTIARETIVPAGGYVTLIWRGAGALGTVGDQLILKNNNSVTVDTISWGNNTTQLNPSINVPGSLSGFERRAAGLDTDDASDWQSL